MIDKPTTGPRKTLLSTLALLLLAAGPALAQPNDENAPAPGSTDQPATGAPPATPPPPPPVLAPEPPNAPVNPNRVKAAAVEAAPATEVPLGLQVPTTSWFTRTPLKVVFGSENMVPPSTILHSSPVNYY